MNEVIQLYGVDGARLYLTQDERSAFLEAAKNLPGSALDPCDLAQGL